MNVAMENVSSVHFDAHGTKNIATMRTRETIPMNMPIISTKSWKLKAEYLERENERLLMALRSIVAVLKLPLHSDAVANRVFAIALEALGRENEFFFDVRTGRVAGEPNNG